MSYPQYSIVIPAYNEGTRIAGALEAVIACVGQRGWSAEVVVVDDGSRDRTAELVRDIVASAAEVRLLQNPGKGSSKISSLSDGMPCLTAITSKWSGFIVRAW